MSINDLSFANLTNSGWVWFLLNVISALEFIVALRRNDRNLHWRCTTLVLITAWTVWLLLP